MILQSLNELYTRLARDESYDLPTPGYGIQKVTFAVVLHPDGSHTLEDARVTISEATKTGGTKTKQIARPLKTPGDSARSGSGLNPNVLCDNTSYLLGYRKDDDKPERTRLCFAALRDKHLALELNIGDPVFSRVCRFLESWSPEKAEEWKVGLDDYAATGFGVFRLAGERNYAHESPKFVAWWDASVLEKPTEDDVLAPCLITGEISPIARLAEPAIKGVNGAAPGGAKLASFNLNAFESYGKEQTYNAPVSKRATFQYCNALNALLGGPQSRKHRLQIGDATTVFWTERKTVIEDLFAEFLDGKLEQSEEEGSEEDEATRRRVQTFLEIMRKGGGADVGALEDDPATKFFILGLSGNVTRLSVRFWNVGSIAQMMDRLKAHYDALRMVRSHPSDPEFPPMWLLLRQTARESKDIPPLLGGAVMQAILTGNPYPQALFHAVLNRIRADRTVNYLRASIIKAVLTRQPNTNHTPPISLDTNRTDKGYLMGRLFATLEKTQEDALPGINATIRDRFYSSASATPGAVFPRILRTYQHHLGKVDPGLRVKREQLVQSIHAHLDGYPAHLTLEHQGLFAVGYYHQRQAFFTKKESPEAPPETINA